MQQNGSKYFAGRPPPHPTLGVNRSKTCSEHGPVAYQINEESQMQHDGRKYFASRLPPANTGELNVKIYVKRYNIYETYQMCF